MNYPFTDILINCTAQEKEDKLSRGKRSNEDAWAQSTVWIAGAKDPPKLPVFLCAVLSTRRRCKTATGLAILHYFRVTVANFLWNEVFCTDSPSTCWWDLDVTVSYQYKRTVINSGLADEIGCLHRLFYTNHSYARHPHLRYCALFKLRRENKPAFETIALQRLT